MQLILKNKQINNKLSGRGDVMHPFFYESIFNLISGTGSLQVLLKGIWKYPILHNINYRLYYSKFRPRPAWLT